MNVKSSRSVNCISMILVFTSTLAVRSSATIYISCEVIRRSRKNFLFVLQSFAGSSADVSAEIWERSASSFSGSTNSKPRALRPLRPHKPSLGGCNCFARISSRIISPADRVFGLGGTCSCVSGDALQFRFPILNRSQGNRRQAHRTDEFFPRALLQARRRSCQLVADHRAVFYDDGNSKAGYSRSEHIWNGHTVFRIKADERY